MKLAHRRVPEAAAENIVRNARNAATKEGQQAASRYVLQARAGCRAKTSAERQTGKQTRQVMNRRTAATKVTMSAYKNVSLA
jgi:hypothetical protein